MHLYLKKKNQATRKLQRSLTCKRFGQKGRNQVKHQLPSYPKNKRNETSKHRNKQDLVCIPELRLKNYNIGKRMKISIKNEYQVKVI